MTNNILQSAEILWPSSSFNDTLAFFTGELSFQLESIFPADAPSQAVLSGNGLRLRIIPGPGQAPHLRILCPDPGQIPLETKVAVPGGGTVEWIAADPPLILPEMQQSFVLSRMGDEDSWNGGRAGMQYRDLIPCRMGGRIIASHIRIPNAGPVPDYVHFHKVSFQLIYCYKGWVKVVYEDQGEPFVMEAGDCVLQAPTIRHRVLESSAGLEVIEIGSPADHETHVDHHLELPNPERNRDREFGGQNFHRHQMKKQSWSLSKDAVFEQQDLGLSRPSRGLLRARVRRFGKDKWSWTASHEGDFYFFFILRGHMTLSLSEQKDQKLSTGDSCVIPPEQRFTMRRLSADIEFLELAMPNHG
jgi:mannose-6-phosphate isomerase-like protein (cupin superfamily)